MESENTNKDAPISIYGDGTSIKQALIPIIPMMNI
jgi:hypothetical protein